MRSQQYGFLVTPQLFNHVVDFAPHLRIEAGGGLVKEAHLRVVDQGHGERETLFLSAGKLAIKRILLLIEAETLEQFLRIALTFVKTREEPDRFDDPHLVGQGSGLKRGADFLL